MDTKPDEVPAELLEALNESEAEFAAGLLVSGDKEREERRRSIARMEAERTAAPRQARV